jgi:hypothetical protein
VVEDWAGGKTTRTHLRNRHQPRQRLHVLFSATRPEKQLRALLPKARGLLHRPVALIACGSETTTTKLEKTYLTILHPAFQGVRRTTHTCTIYRIYGCIMDNVFSRKDKYIDPRQATWLQTDSRTNFRFLDASRNPTI